MARTTLIGGKTVLLNDPYLPSNNHFFSTGYELEMQTIKASWTKVDKSKNPLTPILYGPPGTGKTSMIIELSRLLKKPLYIMHGHDGLLSDELAGGGRPGDEKGKVEYFLSPITTAMNTGGIALFEEISKANPRSLALLTSVLDGSNYMENNLINEKIYAHPEFRFVCTANSNELDLPEAIWSRLQPRIEMPLPTKHQIETILMGYYEINQEIKKLINLFWILYYENSSCGTQPPSVRDIVLVFDYAEKITAMNESKSQTLETTNHGISERSLRLAFKTFFSKK